MYERTRYDLVLLFVLHSAHWDAVHPKPGMADNTQQAFCRYSRNVPGTKGQQQ